MPGAADDPKWGGPAYEVSRLFGCMAVVVGLAACSSSPTPSSKPGPTKPPSAATVSYSLIGPPPTNCPGAPPLAPLDAFGPSLGAPPVWAVGFEAEGGRTVLRIVDSIHGRSGPHGLYRKVLWVTQPGYGQLVGLRGRSLSSGAPLWFQFGDDEPTTAPVLDPAHPGVPGSGDPGGTPENRYANFPSYLFVPGRVDAANTALAHFGTALRALQAVGIVTQKEFHDWMGRARDASEWDPAAELRRRASAGTVHPAAPPYHDEPPLPKFLRLVPAPNEECELHGGRVRMIGVEVFDTQMILHWRMAPPPDVELAFPDVAAAEEQETEGLPEEERENLRRWRGSRNWHILGAFQIVDDLGNTYTSHSSFGSAGQIMTGQHIITPALQEGATSLVVDALGIQITVPLVTLPE